MKKFLFQLSFSLAFFGQSVLAGEHKIGQKDKIFHQGGKKIEKIQIKVGDTIVFFNDDKIAHNVFSISPADKFNMKVQKPNTEIGRKFEKEGEIKVRCAIHPKMKLTVSVGK